MMIFPVLPQDLPWQVKPIVEIREKFERRINKDMSPAVNDDRTDQGLRARVGFEATYKKTTTVRVVLQYGPTRFSSVSGSGVADYKDAIEASLGTKLGGGNLLIGRQRVIKGDQRILGLGDWGSKGRSWDGLRYTRGPWDTFVGRLGSNAVQNREASIAFVSHANKLGETMLVNKTDTRANPSVNVWTLDHRYVKQFKKVRLAVEGAYQVGRSADKNHRAFLMSVRPSYQVTPKLSVHVQGDIASGGSNASTSNAYDLMYSTCVTSFGWAETQGQKNVRSYLIGAEWRPNEKLCARLDWHSYDLYSKKDGWYGPGGALNKRPGGTYLDPTGLSGRHIGSEINLHVQWNVDKRSMFIVGAAVLNPGTFVKTMNGGSAARQKLVYLAYQFKL